MSKYPTGCVFNSTTIWQVKEDWLEGGMSIKDESGNEVFNVKHEPSSTDVFKFIDNRVDEEIGQIKEEVHSLGMNKFDIIIGEFLECETLLYLG